MREGDLLRGKQRFAEAIAAYDRAIARIKTPGPTDWLVFYDRGICYERSRQWTKAEADFKHALTLAPDQPFVLNYLGYSWADMGQNLAQARAMIDKAVQHRPNDGAIVDSLGWVMLRQGETSPKRCRTLERAVELEPEDASINGHLGDAYWAAGRKLEATYQWRRALTFNPEPDDAAKLEAKLQGGPAADRGRAASRVCARSPDRAGAGQGQPLPARDRPPRRRLPPARQPGGVRRDRRHAACARRPTTLSLHVTGPFAAGLAGEPDNLVLRAARALAAEAGVTAGAHLVLDKHLPVASGHRRRFGRCGGGAAAAVPAVARGAGARGVGQAGSRAWRRRAGLPRRARRTHGRYRRASGTRAGAAGVRHRAGQSRESPVATAEVFRARHGAWSEPAALPAGWDDAAAMAADLGRLRNDLEPAAIALRPVIGDVLAALAATPGCLLARMSGSGATCFGLYRRCRRGRRGAADSCRSRAGGAGPARCDAAERGFTSRGTRPIHASAGWGVAKW